MPFFRGEVMEQHETIQDIKERLVKIEMLLENMSNANDLKLLALDDKIKVSNHRIEDLEDTIKWLWRTLGGALVTGAFSILIALIKGGVF